MSHRPRLTGEPATGRRPELLRDWSRPEQQHKFVTRGELLSLLLVIENKRWTRRLAAGLRKAWRTLLGRP